MGLQADGFLPMDDAGREHLRAALERLAPMAPQTAALRRAAVAVVVVEEGAGADLPGIPVPAGWSGEAALLLTRRALGLRQHAGQWALPGGAIDALERWLHVGPPLARVDAVLRSPLADVAGDEAGFSIR